MRLSARLWRRQTSLLLAGEWKMDMHPEVPLFEFDVSRETHSTDQCPAAPTKVCRAKRTALDLRRSAAGRIGPKPPIEPFSRCSAFPPGICSAEHPGENCSEEVNHVLGTANGVNSPADVPDFRLVFVFGESHLDQSFRIPVTKNVAYGPSCWLTCSEAV
jgi:hypothetical protein